MEEQMLPSIGDMYSCTRENHDYNAIRVYEGAHKNFAMNSKPTKKDHYLDRVIRLDCSPGPASTYCPTQTLPTNSSPGLGRTPSRANGQRNRPTSMKFATENSRTGVLPRTTTQSPCPGPSARNSSKTLVKRPISQTHASTILTSYPDQAPTMSLSISAIPARTRSGSPISPSNPGKFQGRKWPPTPPFLSNTTLLLGAC